MKMMKMMKMMKVKNVKEVKKVMKVMNVKKVMKMPLPKIASFTIITCGYFVARVLRMPSVAIVKQVLLTATMPAS